MKFAREAGGVHPLVDAGDLEAVLLERAQMLAARAEINLVAGPLQPCAVEGANRARAHHQDLHSIRYRERADGSASLASLDMEAQPSHRETPANLAHETIIAVATLSRWSL